MCRLDRLTGRVLSVGARSRANARPVLTPEGARTFTRVGAKRAPHFAERLAPPTTPDREDPTRQPRVALTLASGPSSQPFELHNACTEAFLRLSGGRRAHRKRSGSRDIVIKRSRRCHDHRRVLHRCEAGSEAIAFSTNPLQFGLQLTPRSGVGFEGRLLDVRLAGRVLWVGGRRRCQTLIEAPRAFGTDASERARAHES